MSMLEDARIRIWNEDWKNELKKNLLIQKDKNNTGEVKVGKKISNFNKKPSPYFFL